MSQRFWNGLLALFVMADLAFTFWRNYRLPFDGDLAATVLPAPWYAQVLHDPFGWSVLTRHDVYSGPNRFFAHAAMGLYWKGVPRLLQLLFTPITSLYVANALFTTVVQAGLLLLLTTYIRLANGGQRTHGWLVAALLMPMFQTAGGYYEQMGITDRATTYTFFYALAMLLVLLLLLPFFRAARQHQPLRLTALSVLLLLGLMVVVAFNGPAANATIAIVLLLIGSYWAWKHGRYWQRPALATTPTSFSPSWLSGQTVWLLGILAGLCLYSLYIGRNNVENTKVYTLPQLYSLLPLGVLRYFKSQAGLPLLLLLVLGNLLLARRTVTQSAGRQRLFTILSWAGLFALGYLLLLPLGGYRPYRPNLLRNDTALPIILVLVFAYGYSTYFLLSQLRGTGKRTYLVGVGLVSAFFLYADGSPNAAPTNDCERWSLDQLARSREPVTELVPDCSVLAWNALHEPWQSEIQAQMLLYWHVTPVKRLYYQR
jgi:hypothetical protein